MKLVHAADLHLDSRLHGLASYTGAPVERLRAASRRALENLVELCIEESASLLLLAGDLYDGDWRDYSTGLFFTKQMAKLRDAGVQVAMIRGNHDAASQITKQLVLPDNVHELSYQAAETRTFDALGVAVHGQSFATRAVTENLAQSYPPPVSGLLNIGLLHTSVNGREGHAPYAPCSLEELIAKGYDYWALGHVHAREVLCREPWVVFPGNLQGRHVREAGDKGASLLTIEGGRVRTVTHRSLDVVRYGHVRVDASSAREHVDGDIVLERVEAALRSELERADGRLLALRVEVIGASSAHVELHRDLEAFVNNVRATAVNVGEDEVWVEKVLVHTQPVQDLARTKHGDDVLAQLLTAVASLRHDAEGLAACIEDLAPLRAKLPVELRDGPDALALDDPEYMAAQLEAVEPLLLARLLAKDPTS